MLLDLSMPNFAGNFQELPNFRAMGDSLSGKSRLADQYARKVGENAPVIAGTRAFQAATTSGVLPPILPFAKDAMRSTIEIVDRYHQFQQDIRGQVLGKVPDVVDKIGGWMKDNGSTIVQNVMGNIVQPIVGAIPIIGGFINAAISFFKLLRGLTAGRRKIPTYTEKGYRLPEFNSENDKGLVEDVLVESRSLDLTSFFLPPPITTDGAYRPGVTFADKAFAVRKIVNNAGNFTGELQIGTAASFTQDTSRLGFVPGTGTSGLKGSPAYVHESLVVPAGKSTIRAWDTGDTHPSQRSALLNVWATVSSPSPAIWTVDADRVMQAWYNYVRVLRDYVHGEGIKRDLTPEQVEAVDRFLAMRMFNVRGRRATINVSDERILTDCIPVKAARRLLTQQAWAQSHKSGLILMADPLGRSEAEQWGAFSGQSAGSQELMRTYRDASRNFIFSNKEYVCSLRPEDVPEGNRQNVQAYRDSFINQGLCSTRVRPPMASADPTFTQLGTVDEPAPPDDEGDDESGTGCEGWSSGSDQDKGGGDPYGSTTSGSGLAALIALGVLGGALAMR